MSKHLGVSTLCSEVTQTACLQQEGNRLVFRPLGQIAVKGRSSAIAVAELVGPPEDLSDATCACLDLFSQGLSCYRARDWAGARACFERSAALESNVPGRDAGITRNPSLVYLELVAEYAREAPPIDWDGVYAMPDR